MSRRYRSDELGAHRSAMDRNRKKIYATQTVCGICGKPVDMALRYPNPMSKTIDHIIPINRGGHPSAIENLQLAHLTCNLDKSDKLLREGEKLKELTETVSNRNLPQSYDWAHYRMQ